jgi:hypothetical protein
MRRLSTGLFSVCFSVFLLGQGTPPPKATIGAVSSHVVPPARTYQFPEGKSYVFSVEWHLFTAGVATVRMNKTGAEQHVTASGTSTGFVNVLYKVHDQFDAAFDARTFCTQQVTKHTEEGSRKRDTQIRMDYAQNKSILDEKNLKDGELKHEVNEIPGCVTDVVTGFFYLGSLPLEPGSVNEFPINDGKTTQVHALVEAREQVKVPAGTFQAVRVKAEAYSGPLKGKGAVWIWYSDDANRTPVQMRSKLGWGTLVFRLQRIDHQ